MKIKKVFLAFAVLFLSFVAIGCNKVKSITVTGKTQIEVDETVQFAYTLDVDADVTVTWSTSDSSIATVDSNGKVTGVKVGSVDVRVTYRKVEGKITINVVEASNEYPVINGATDITIDKGSQFVPLQGITATDKEDGDLTSSIQYSGNVNVNLVGEYTATYKVTDSDGNMTTVNRKVTVVLNDKDAPQFTGVGNTTIIVGDPNFTVLSGVQAMDAVDGDVTSNITVEGSVDVWKLGEYTLVYSVKDASNNEKTATRVVTVGLGQFDFKDEVIETLPTLADGKYSVDCNSGEIDTTLEAFALARLTFTATTTVAGKLTLALTNATSVGEVNVLEGTHEYVVFFRYSEEITNGKLELTPAASMTDLALTEMSFMFGFAVDAVAPVINVPSGNVVLPGNIADSSVLAPFVLSGVTATDNIDGILTSRLTVDFGTITLGTFTGTATVKIKVEDNSGNVTIEEREVEFTKVYDTGLVKNADFATDDLSSWKLNNGSGDPVLTVEDGAMVHRLETATNPGWDSAASPFLRIDQEEFLIDSWYMLKYDVKAEKARKMSIRAGWDTVGDQYSNWIDNFSGAHNVPFSVTTDWQTCYVVFYVHQTEFPAEALQGSMKFEFKIGTYTWGSEEQTNTVYFDNVQLYLLSNDNTAPTLSIDTSLPTTFGVGHDAIDLTKYVIVKDYEDGNSLQVTASNIEGSVDMATAGTYSVKYTVTDSGNLSSEITVTFKVLAEADTTAPVITEMPGLKKEYDQGENINASLLLLAVTAYDDVDGAIAITPDMIETDLDTKVAGTYTITYTVKDSSGNVGTHEITVVINDKEAPKFSGKDTITYHIGDAFNFDDIKAIVSVKDNVDGDIELTEANIEAQTFTLVDGKFNEIGEYTLTISVTDAADNNAKLVFNVNVIEAGETEIVADQELVDLISLEKTAEGATATYEDGVVTIDVTSPGDWASAAKIKYTFDSISEGNTYLIRITAKADQARGLVFNIGQMLWSDPWMNKFTIVEGYDNSIIIGTEYKTYEVMFTYDKPNADGGPGAEFCFGNTGHAGDIAGNNIYISEFKLYSTKEQVKDDSVLVFDDFEAYNETADMLDLEERWFRRCLPYGGPNTDVLEGLALETIDGNKVLALTYNSGGEYMAKRMFAGTEFSLTDEYEFVRFKISASQAEKIKVWLYWSGGQNGVQFVISEILKADGYCYIPLTKWGHTGSQITGLGLSMSYQQGNVCYFDDIAFTKTAPNTAPVISLTPEGIAALEDLVLYEGQNLMPIITEFVQYIKIADAEESISLNLSMFDFGGLNPANPVAGTYNVTVKCKDSGGLDSNVLTLPIVINPPTTNTAPVVSIAPESKAFIENMELEMGKDLTADFADLLALISMEDAEDDAIDPANIIVDFAGLNLKFPVAGTYTLGISCKDSEGLRSDVLTITLTVVAPDVLVFDDFEGYADTEAMVSISDGWFRRIDGVNYTEGIALNTVEENNRLALSYNNSKKYIARKDFAPTGFKLTNDYKYLRFRVDADQAQKVEVWLYWSGGQNGVNHLITDVLEADGYCYYAISEWGKTASQLTGLGLAVNYQNGSVIYFDDVEFVKALPNAAPVVSISAENLQALSAMTFTEGVDLTSTFASLMGMVNINDREDGAIAATVEMFDLDGLNLANPVVGTYNITIKCKDSNGVDSNVLTLPIEVTPVPVNQAPVISISPENLAALANMEFVAGTDLTTTFTSLLSMIEITDDNDTITPDVSMVNLGGLNLAFPVIGEYTITIKCKDSEELESNTLSLTIVVVAPEENDAPVVSIDSEVKEIIEGTEFEMGVDLTAMFPTLLEAITITDEETITPAANMVNLGSLNPTFPVAGTYTISVSCKDVYGVASNVLELTITVVAPDVLVFDNFQGYADTEAMVSISDGWFRRIDGVNYTEGIALNTVEENNRLALSYNNSKKYIARKDFAPTGFKLTNDYKYLRFRVDADQAQKVEVWLYWSGGQNGINKEIATVLKADGYCYYAISEWGKTASQLTGLGLAVNYQAGSVIYFDDVEFVKALPNTAPVVSFSTEGMAALGAMKVYVGQDLTEMYAMLKSYVQINDAEDGVIDLTDAMINLNGLNLENPTVGTFYVTIKCKDSKGADSNTLTLPIYIRADESPAVIEMIDALDGTDADAIQAARTAYEALPAIIKARVTNLDKLVTFEAAEWKKCMVGLPASAEEVDEYDSELYATINGILDSYATLSDDIKAKLATEKALLDSLKVKLAEVWAASLSDLPETSTVTGYDVVLARRLEAAKAIYNGLSDELKTLESVVAAITKVNALETRLAIYGETVSTYVHFNKDISSWANETPILTKTTGYDEAHVYLENKGDKKTVFYVTWKIAPKAYDEEENLVILKSGYIVPVNSGMIHLVYTDPIPWTQFNITLFDEDNHQTSGRLDFVVERIVFIYKAPLVVDMIDALDGTDAAAIQAARSAYEALSDESKAKVTNIDDLVTLEANEWKKGLIGLPASAEEVEEYDSELYVTIYELLTSYADLSNETKAELTTEKALLDALKAKLDEIQAATVNAVIDLIDALDGSSVEAIEAARSAYEALNDANKALITNIDELVAYETEVWAASLSDLPETSTVTGYDVVLARRLEAAKAIYNGLSDELKALESVVAAITKVNALETRLAIYGETVSTYVHFNKDISGFISETPVLTKTTGYDEAHVYVKNNGAKKTVFQVTWNVASKAYDEEGNVVALTGGYVIPVDSGTLHLVFTEPISWTEFNMVLFTDDNAQTSGRLDFVVERIVFIYKAPLVVDMIDALDGTDADAIQAARAAYEALSNESKAKVTNIDDLVTLEANEWKKGLVGLPASAEEVETYDSDLYATVNNLLDSYDSLSDEIKAKLTTEKALLDSLKAKLVELNSAPVVNISSEGMTALSALHVYEGQDLTDLYATIKGYIQITDNEDGTITLTDEMINLNGLDLENPVAGTYCVTIQCKDSLDADSNVLTLPIVINPAPAE